VGSWAARETQEKHRREISASGEVNRMQTARFKKKPAAVAAGQAI
jgi:hypothetical protein